MDHRQSTALTAALLIAGVVLFAVPVVAPAEAPDDRVEYYVEGDWGDLQGQQNLAYENVSAAQQAVFDRARQQRPDTVNLSVSESPPELTPPADGIDIYNVRYDGEYYLMQVKHLAYDVDFVTQQLPRLGAIAIGALLIVAAAYRRFAR